MDQDGRVFKRRRYESDTIKVIVGSPPTKPISVHQDVLTETSKFFRAALDKEWKEKAERTIKLPEDRRDVVSAYVDWLYSGHINAMCSVPYAEMTKYDSNKEFNHQTRLYVFGEKVQDDMFCNMVIGKIAELEDSENDKASWSLSNKTIEIAYAGTSKTSPIRRLFADIWAAFAAEDWYEDEEGEAKLDREYLIDVAKASVRNRLEPDKKLVYRGIYAQRERYFK